MRPSIILCSGILFALGPAGISEGGGEGRRQVIWHANQLWLRFGFQATLLQAAGAGSAHSRSSFEQAEALK